MARSRHDEPNQPGPGPSRRPFAARPDKEDCRCTCSIHTLISGDAEIKKGHSKDYALKVRFGFNDGCTGTDHCTHETKWDFRGDSTGCTLEEQKSTSVRVKVKANATPASIVLVARVTGKCKCKGPGDKLVDCTAIGDNGVQIDLIA